MLAFSKYPGDLYIYISGGFMKRSNALSMWSDKILNKLSTVSTVSD